ncbi:hypothetical protein OSB04_000201 [Centaurea solstitialis]|uniref:Phosphoglycerate mutase n=1 Tax=Centaurea solstitialis TaxID=347529 RepID=A0AA38U0C6_9ASTR|nr:hypothetical protein OSB04_000201 [Centaurea solstitialis]
MGAYESIPQTDDERQQEDDDDINHENEETRNLLEDDNDDYYIMNNDQHEQDINEISPSYSTPRFDLSIAPSHVPRAFSLESFNDDPTITELYIICHGECHMKLKPDLVGGRCPEAALTPNGKRQARALAVFLKSQGIRFDAVYTSPLDRARATAIPICQETNFPEQMIETSNALQEMSQGVWEGRQQSDVYTPSVLSLMERFQPDFCAPSGETLRQVEFRIVQFLNAIVGPQKSSSTSDYIPPIAKPPRQSGFPKKKSSRSRLEMVRTGGGGGDQEADDEMSPRVPPNYNMQHDQHPEILLPTAKCDKPTVPQLPSVSSSSSSCNKSCIGIFSHSIPIKCLVTGILGCSPIMSNKICIQDSSVTVLQHSGKMGWLIKRLNDTSHLKLM